MNLGGLGWDQKGVEGKNNILSKLIVWVFLK